MSLRDCFLRWVSKTFDVAIITATQKSSLTIGKTYLLKSSGNPFNSIVQSKVLDLKDGYVQYCFLREDGTELSTKWSDSIDTFKKVYIEKRYE